MFVTRALAATAIAGAALGLSAPLAAAAGPADPSGPNNIMVMPGSVRPGGTLTIMVDGSMCRGRGRTSDAIVESRVFSRTALRRIAHQGSAMATAKVLAAAKSGTYKVTATCGGKSITGGDFTVAPGAAAGAGSSGMGAATGAAPTKGAKTGVGGSHSGLDGTQTVLGATLLAAAVTGGGLFLIRRRASAKS